MIIANLSYIVVTILIHYHLLLQTTITSLISTHGQEAIISGSYANEAQLRLTATLSHLPDTATLKRKKN